MIKRNITFGYKMTGGEIVVNEPEAAAVRQVFSLYLHGISLREIAGVMTVPYNEGTEWDKHKVKRIIDNPKYIGADGYQPLIDETDYTAANRLKTGKNTSTPLPCPEDIQVLRAAAYCRDCGGRFIRKINHSKGRWSCLNQNCDNKTALRDDGIKNAVSGLLNDIIQNPGILQTGQSPRPASLAANRLQNEVNREMSKAKPDTGHTQNLLLSLAAEKYAACVDTHTTFTLCAIFQNHEPANQFDRGLFDDTVQKVMVAGDGIITLRLKNGWTLPDKM